MSPANLQREEASGQELVRGLKAPSSRGVREVIGLREFEWQDGCGAFTVSVSNRESVVRCIANQEAHHTTRSFSDEISRRTVPFFVGAHRCAPLHACSFYILGVLVHPGEAYVALTFPSPRVRGERVARERQERGPSTVFPSNLFARSRARAVFREISFRSRTLSPDAMPSSGLFHLRPFEGDGENRQCEQDRNPSPGAAAPPSPRSRGARGDREGYVCEAPTKFQM
jgi:hypothetical protein